jgi:hypothetical protein
MNKARPEKKLSISMTVITPPTTAWSRNMNAPPAETLFDGCRVIRGKVRSIDPGQRHRAWRQLIDRIGTRREV